MKARIKFRKYGAMRFVGHLDMMRYFQKAMRRAEIPVAFTGGYSPHMVMSFAQPLGVGITSDGEYLDIELTEPATAEKVVKQLNAVMVSGIEVVDFCEIPEEKRAGGMTMTAGASYRVSLLASAKSCESRIEIPAGWEGKIGEFLARKEILAWKKTKKNEKEVDIRPLIFDMRVEAGDIFLLLAAGSEENANPRLVMEAFQREAGLSGFSFHYHRLDIYGKDGRGRLLPLSEFGIS